MKQLTIEALTDQVMEWNSKHPVGTPVMRYKIINPLAEPEETKTRSAAWVMAGHSAMVMVEGVSGGVLLESVVPLSASSANSAVNPAEPKHPRSTVSIRGSEN